MYYYVVDMANIVLDLVIHVEQGEVSVQSSGRKCTAFYTVPPTRETAPLAQQLPETNMLSAPLTANRTDRPHCFALQVL